MSPQALSQRIFHTLQLSRWSSAARPHLTLASLMTPDEKRCDVICEDLLWLLRVVSQVWSVLSEGFQVFSTVEHPICAALVALCLIDASSMFTNDQPHWLWLLLIAIDDWKAHRIDHGVAASSLTCNESPMSLACLQGEPISSRSKYGICACCQIRWCDAADCPSITPLFFPPLASVLSQGDYWNRNFQLTIQTVKKLHLRIFKAFLTPQGIFEWLIQQLSWHKASLWLTSSPETCSARYWVQEVSCCF